MENFMMCCMYVLCVSVGLSVLFTFYGPCLPEINTMMMIDDRNISRSI